MRRMFANVDDFGAFIRILKKACIAATVTRYENNERFRH